MKQHIYNCNSTRITAQAAMREHLKLYPDGLPTYNKRSKRCVYGELGFVIYETKTSVVISAIGE